MITCLVHTKGGEEEESDVEAMTRWGRKRKRRMG